LSTARLVLRATVPADVALLHDRIFSDVEVIRFVFCGKQFTATESARFVRERFNFAGADVGLSTLEERGSGEVVGFSGLIPCPALGRQDLELGFVLARHAWGKGYATEIGRAQIDFGFNHLRQARLLALVDPANTPSIIVLAKLGMRPGSEVTIEGRGDRRVYCIEA
jgi:ribosomal-protein-alanine N-acetyltransferase